MFHPGSQVARPGPTLALAGLGCLPLTMTRGIKLTVYDFCTTEMYCVSHIYVTCVLYYLNLNGLLQVNLNHS